jgi:hypothetical protein
MTNASYEYWMRFLSRGLGVDELKTNHKARRRLMRITCVGVFLIGTAAVGARQMDPKQEDKKPPKLDMADKSKAAGRGANVGAPGSSGIAFDEYKAPGGGGGSAPAPSENSFQGYDGSSSPSESFHLPSFNSTPGPAAAIPFLLSLLRRRRRAK